MKANSMRCALALAGIVVVGSAAASPAAKAPGPSASRCAALARATMPDSSTVITTAVQRDPVPAEIRPAGDARPFPPAAAMPVHCEIVGKMQERQGANGQTYAIKFHLRLPTAWNGRFVFQGGGGSDGVL